MNLRTRLGIYAAVAVLPVVGGLAGLSLGGSKPVVYSAESRLAMGTANAVIDPQTQETASNYTRYVTPAMVIAKLPRDVAPKVRDVVVSPVPESNILRVEAKASDGAAAVAASKVGTALLTQRVSALNGPAKARQAMAKLESMARQVAQAQSRVNSSGGSGAGYVEAQTQLTTLQAQQSALSSTYQDQIRSTEESQLTMVSQATPTGDNATSQRQVYGLGGLGAGALLAYIIVRIVNGIWPASAESGQDSRRESRERRSDVVPERARSRRADPDRSVDVRPESFPVATPAPAPRPAVEPWPQLSRMMSPPSPRRQPDATPAETSEASAATVANEVPGDAQTTERPAVFAIPEPEDVPSLLPQSASFRRADTALGMEAPSFSVTPHPVNAETPKRGLNGLGLKPMSRRNR